MNLPTDLILFESFRAFRKILMTLYKIDELTNKLNYVRVPESFGKFLMVLYNTNKLTNGLNSVKEF
jgi:hypothetical protein